MQHTTSNLEALQKLRKKELAVTEPEAVKPVTAAPSVPTKDENIPPATEPKPEEISKVDIMVMNKAELIAFIEKEELEIDDPKTKTLEQLRQVIFEGIDWE